MLQPQHRLVWDALLTEGAGWVWRLCYWLGGNYLWRLMRELFAVESSAQVQQSEQRLLQLFDDIHAQRLCGRVRVTCYMSSVTCHVLVCLPLAVQLTLTPTSSHSISHFHSHSHSDSHSDSHSHRCRATEKG